MAAKAKVGGGGAPQIQMDNMPAAKTVARQAERDRLAEINAGLSRRLATLRSGVQVSTEQIKTQGE